MSEHNGQVIPVLHITQDEEGDEHDASQHQHRQPVTVFTRLRKTEHVTDIMTTDTH